MNIVVNGEEIEVKNDITIYELLIKLKVFEKTMAAAINMEVVKKDNWQTYKIKQNDRVEFLQFVGGG